MLANISGTFDNIHVTQAGFLAAKLPLALRDDVHRVSFSGSAAAALDVAATAGVERGEIDLVGSHGQTICHLPRRKKCAVCNGGFPGDCAGTNRRPIVSPSCLTLGRPPIKIALG